MTSSSPGSSAVLERQETTQRYPQARVIVLDDDVNTSSMWWIASGGSFLA